MANFAINICKTDQRADGDYPISIRITQHRKSASLKTQYYVRKQGLNKNLKLADQDIHLIILQKIKKAKGNCT